MTTYQIRHRLTATVLFEGKYPSLRACVEDAVARRADLTGANLEGADLTGADLEGADLTYAVLTGADLTGANLTVADLTRANLADANLADANLTDANLTRARLTGAHVEDPAAFRLRHPDVPVVEQLDAKVLAAIECDGGALEMRGWHTCETTHCRAGWAITVAGPAGAALEERHGPAAAGALIYLAATGRVPDFYETDNAVALEDIRRAARA